MSEEFDSSIPPSDRSAARQSELSAWLDLAQQLIGASVTLLDLFQTELRLAVVSARRLLFISVLMIPILLLAWTGFSVLLSWLAYLLAGRYFLQPELAVTVGLFIFLLLQLLAGFALYRVGVEYRRNMRLPLTRRQIQLFTEGLRRDIRPPE